MTCLARGSCRRRSATIAANSFRFRAEISELFDQGFTSTGRIRADQHSPAVGTDEGAQCEPRLGFARVERHARSRLGAEIEEGGFESTFAEAPALVAVLAAEMLEDASPALRALFNP